MMSLSKAVSFGKDYYYALGGMEYSEPVETATETNAATETGEDVLFATTIDSDDEKDAPRFDWEAPPWRKDTNRKEGSKDLQGDDITDMACSTQSSLFLTKSGAVYQTGTLHGRLCQDPSLVTIKLPLKCVQVSAGRHYCLARMEGGQAVVSWGAGHFGQLGIGSPQQTDVDGNHQNQIVTFAPEPVVIERLLPRVTGSPIVQVAAGDWHGVALTESGRLWCWGSNRNFQCGRKPPKGSGAGVAPTITIPLPVACDTPMQSISAGRSHSVALSKPTETKGPQVFCWGSAAHGQCGNSVRRSTGVAPPRRVEALADLPVAQVAAGGNHSLALSTGGRVFAWGDGSEGQLGLGVPVGAQCKPRQVADVDFVSIAAAHQDKWGGEGETLSTQDLAKVPRIARVYAGPSYSAAVSSAGHVYVWGCNDVGQLGVPTPSDLPLKDEVVDAKLRSTFREDHVQTFDSRHNVLLPMRIETLDNMDVRLLACGSTNLWCLGRERTEEEKKDTIIGKTLFEVQDAQLDDLHSSKGSLFSSSGASFTSNQSTFTSDQTDSSFNDETITLTSVATPVSYIDAASEIRPPSAVELSSEFVPGTPTQRKNMIQRFSLRKMINRIAARAQHQGNSAKSSSNSRRRAPAARKQRPATNTK